MSERAKMYRFVALALGVYVIAQPWLAWSWWIWGGFVLLALPVFACAVLDRHEASLPNCYQESRGVPSPSAPMTTYESPSGADGRNAPPTTAQPPAGIS